MDNEISIEADVLRCGYDVGYFDKTDIVNWADRQIEASDDPSDTLLDLSMIRETHPLDVMKLLRALGTTDPFTPIDTRIGFIGLLLAERRMTTRLAMRGLLELVHEPTTTQEQKSEIYPLDDRYDNAIAGTYGTMEDVERELYNFVSPYAKRLAQQYPHLIPSTR